MQSIRQEQQLLMQPSVHRRMTAQNDSNVNTQVWALLTSVPLWALPKNFSYLQKLSQSSQIVPSPTIKSSLLSLSDTSLHELSAAEGHASAYFQDRWYVNPLDLPTKPFSARTPPHQPFHPRSHLCLLPQMPTCKSCSTKRTNCSQVQGSCPYTLLPKHHTSGEGPFHVITFLQVKGTTAWF